MKVRPCPACLATESSPEESLNHWEMARCTRCGLLYTGDVPSPGKIREIYEEAYTPGKLYDRHLIALQHMLKTGRTRQGFYRNYVFLKRYRPNPGDRLLKLGCGIGTFLLAAKRAGWAAEGVDVSPTALAASASVHRIPVHQGTIESLALAPGAYRAVVCWEFLEHLPFPGEVLRRARELLRADGILVCSVPNHGPRVPRLASRWGPASLPPVHLNFWSRDSFRIFAERNGFRPILLVAKRSLLGLASARKHPFRSIFSQLGALVGLCEGPQIFAVLAPLR